MKPTFTVPRPGRPQILILLLLAGMAPALPMPGHAARHTLALDCDRMTLVAWETPLTNILNDLVHAGINVRISPDINPLVTSTIVDVEVEDGMEKLLRPYGYVLIWDVVPGPVGDLPRLAEIQIFHQDRPRNLQQFAPDDGNFRVVRGPLPDSPMYVADEVLLALKPGVSVAEFRLFLSQIGGTIIDSIPSLGLYRIRVPAGANIPSLVEQIANNPIVSRAEPNFAAKLPVPEITDRTGAAGAVRNITAAPGAAKVAVLDSGLMDGAGIDGLVAARYDAVNPDRPLSDRAGHGTQMAMIASGAVTPEGTAGDSADGVPVVAIRAFDDNGITSNFALMRAVDRALAEGAKVLNMSWGTETPSSFIKTTMAYAQQQGMIIVAAAGNEPTGTPVYPSAFDGVIAVSAVGENNQIWEQSNYGSQIVVSAPGKASFPVGHDGPPGRYAGTSISSAYTANLVARYLTEHPNASAGEITRALRAAATDEGASGRDAYYGYGVLDDAAVQRLLDGGTR